MINIEEKYEIARFSEVQWLYQKYSAPLLGYLSKIISNPHDCEECLVTILCDFSKKFAQDIQQKEVSWLTLFQYSRSFLSQLRTEQHNPKGNSLPCGNLLDLPQLNGLSNQQKEIFCLIYYYGKSIGDLANQMGESEDVIRSQFKSSFDKVRSAHGN